MRNELPLVELVAAILQSMLDAQHSAKTVGFYERIFKRLVKLAKQRGEEHYSMELGEAFIADSSYARAEGYCHSRFCAHSRSVQFMESYIKTGQVDWSMADNAKEYVPKSEELSDAKAGFQQLMSAGSLKESTQCSYLRIVGYFLSYLEDKGYKSLSQIVSGDVVGFLAVVCKEHYHTVASLGAGMPGLRMFLQSSPLASQYAPELPAKLHRKTDIMEVYSDEEHARIMSYLENSSDISHRNKAICMLALETGLRAVDICNLKISDIDWQHDTIHIVQEKTGHPLNLPLRASYGNELSDYLLSERPISDSKFVFLQTNAPFNPLKSGHSACYSILFSAVSGAGIEANGRHFGTRIARHSMASRMLRSGVPYPAISEALGQRDPNSAMRYISADGVKLAECTLKLPGKRGASDGE